MPEGVYRTGGFQVGRYAGRGAELKFFDGTKASTATGTGGTIFNDSLVLIQQGAGESNRIGRKCVVKSIHLRGQVLLAAKTSSNQTSDVVRIMLYWDKQTNGAAATVANILASADSDAFRNLQNSGRFRILYDKWTNMSALSGQGDGTTFAYGEVAKHFRINKRCHVPLEFDASTGAITDLTTNNIGVLVISQAGAASVEYNWRIRFSDN